MQPVRFSCLRRVSYAFAAAQLVIHAAQRLVRLGELARADAELRVAFGQV